MKCETPTCSNPAVRRLVLAPNEAHPRGRIARVCTLCREALVKSDIPIAKERAL